MTGVLDPILTESTSKQGAKDRILYVLEFWIVQQCSTTTRALVFVIRVKFEDNLTPRDLE